MPHTHTTAETGKVQSSHYKCTRNSREQSPRLGELLAGVLCSQPCGVPSRALQESASQRLKLLHLLHSPDVHHGINLPSAGKRDPQMTIKSPQSNLAQPRGSAFSHTATSTGTGSPCSGVSAGLRTRCSSACRLPAAWESHRTSAERGHGLC